MRFVSLWYDGDDEEVCLQNRDRNMLSMKQMMVGGQPRLITDISCEAFVKFVICSRILTLIMNEWTRLIIAVPSSGSCQHVQC